jgi:multidrug efflux pump subunit AcrB
MDITRAALEKTRVTTVVLAILILGGVSAYKTLPRNEDPGFIIRTAVVTTLLPGASPERVEMLVTDKLEKIIQEMPELDYINSESMTGLSMIYVNIQASISVVQPVWDKLRRKVDKARGELPDGIIGPDVNDEFGDVFGILMTITGDGYGYAELRDVAQDVRSELLRGDEVAKVEIHGLQDERIFVEYDNARLRELGLSPMQLQSILESQNIIQPGGNINTGDERISLEPTGNLESVEDLRRSVIQLPGRSDLVYLEDIARVERSTVDPPSLIVRSSGERGLALGISMREGGNVIGLGDFVSAVVERLNRLYPIGLEFRIMQFQPEIVSKKISDFSGNLLQAIALVAGVMFITLGIRTGLIVAALIPVTMLATLLVMSMMGIGLDQMSLAALIIALGMLVDNAIVMSESIMGSMAAGKPPKDAAIESANELKVPLLTSSLTTAAAFLPIYLAEDSVGEYTAPIFLVVTIALLLSWLLALSMITLLCVKFLKVKANVEAASFDGRVYKAYRGILITMLKQPLLTLGVVGGVFVLSMMAMRNIPNIFFPPSDRPLLEAEFEMPFGTPIETMAELMAEVETYFQDELMVTEDRPDGITGWTSFIGGPAPRYVLVYSPGARLPHYALLLVDCSDRAQVDELMEPIRAFCAERYPDMKVSLKPPLLGKPIDNPVEVRISGPDAETLFALAEQVKAKIAEVPGSKNIDDDWGARTKKLVVDVDQARARRAGVSNQDVAVSLQALLSGFEVTQYREHDEVIPVTMRSVSNDREDLGNIEALNVFSQLTGRSVPLKQVADTRVVWEPSDVFRRDRLRTVTVRAQVHPGTTAAMVFGVLKPWLEEEQAGWTFGHFWEFGGEAEGSAEATAAIGAQLPISGFIIILLLVTQFNSLRRPLIILMTIPLALIGVVLGLIVMKSYFGFMTLLGVISLAGIVINNAIVLLDTIRIEIEDNGRPPQDAVVRAAQQRMRPILLTTATTVGGMIPLYLGGGPMWEPMAVAIMFGLIVSTVLTLGVVPVLYRVLFRVKYKDYKYVA